MDLPYDVWRHIVSFVPDECVQRLLGINRTLFEIVMDELYSTVEISQLNDRTWWILSNLQNPMIASRVRCLRFCSDIAGDFHSAWSQRYQGDTWTIRARKAIHNNFHALMPYWHHSEITACVDGVKKIKTSFHDSITMLIGALPALPNLSEFEDRHSYQEFTPVYDMKLFYGAGLVTIRPNLRKLVLRREIGSFSEILNHIPYLPCLQELKITLVSVPYRRKGSHDLEMQNLVASFINRHKSTIQTLSLHSLGLNLSPLFLALETFPTLQKLEIHFSPTDLAWWKHSMPGLSGFIRDHMGTLRHLTWYLVVTSGAGLLVFSALLLDDAVTLSQLKTLSVRLINHRDFESLLVQCRCSVNSLTRLSLPDFPLYHNQVQSLVSIYSSPSASLVNLNIAVKLLTPSLILLFGERLPGLKKLAIYASRIKPSSETSFSNKMILKSVNFPDWNLYDIGIWKELDGQRVELNFMCMLAVHIPRVSSFWGTGCTMV